MKVSSFRSVYSVSSKGGRDSDSTSSQSSQPHQQFVIFYVIADHESLTSLSENELRKDFRKWIAPPDPSVNFHSASAAHHEGTAAWCTEGSTAEDWKTSGCLLWIHGKRTYPTTFWT